MEYEKELTRDQKAKQGHPTFFFLNGNLHKWLRAEPRSDQLLAWDAVDEVKRIYRLSHFRRTYERAYRVGEVAKILNRSKSAIQQYTLTDRVVSPQKYTGPAGKYEAKYYSKQDIIDIHAHMQLLHRGRPRKDGMITPDDMPTYEQLMAILNDDQVYYVKDGDDFIPIFRQEY